MRYEIQYQPSYALAIIHLDDGERFRAEAGAMVSICLLYTSDAADDN